MAHIAPMDAIHIYHSKERQLFTRMVFDHAMDPNKSMEVIAFWLWLEENGHGDVIRKINSLDDATLLQVASVGQEFIQTLHHRPAEMHGSPNPSADAAPNSYSFRQAAMQGITYYLHNVCFKALEDLRKKAEVEKLVSLMHKICLDYNKASTAENNVPRFGPLAHLGRDANVGHERISGLSPLMPGNWQPYVPHGEGTSSGREENFEKYMKLFPSTFEWPFVGHHSSIPPLSLGYHRDHDTSLGSSTRSSAETSSNIPRDERTLFVTFSNGYPLSREELYTFFMRNFGNVETVTIQETFDGKPPLYAHVSFYSLDTLMRVLNGNTKVKFMTKGKHLWARRFIPKKKPKT